VRGPLSCEWHNDSCAESGSMRLMDKWPGIHRVAKIFMRNVKEIVPEPWVSSLAHRRTRNH
jgi:hypothetical protein